MATGEGCFEICQRLGQHSMPKLHNALGSGVLAMSSRRKPFETFGMDIPGGSSQTESQATVLTIRN